MHEFLNTPLVVLHVMACMVLVLVVLLQPGKSGGMGAFTGVAAQQVFGGRGAGNFLTKITWGTAATFFLTSVTLAYLSSSADESLLERGKVAVNTLPPAPSGSHKADEPARPAQQKPASPAKPASSP